jgi:aspartyl-tRNA(Asn)/glutamyl-tRNA(Gln) amidotransferase subunit A
MKGEIWMESIFFYQNPETVTTEGGDLKGLKILIQPNISAAGWPTEAGSKALLNFKALEDATIIQKLRQAGAELAGSTRMSEFGLGLQNSQAGEGVRQKIADAELVLDLMGECRLAASRAGAGGFKPSYGLISHLGLIGLIPSMECCGIIAGNVKNMRDILKTIAGPDERDFAMPEEKIPDFSLSRIDPHKTTIGIIVEAQKALTPDQESGFLAALAELEKAGFSLKKLSLPEFELFSLVHNIAGSVEASSCAGRYDSVRYGQRAPGAKNWNEMYLQSRDASFSTLLKSYLIQGAYFQFEKYDSFEDACRIRARLISEMQRLTRDADFLVLPSRGKTAAGAATPLAETYAQFALTAFANVSGQPVLYLPPTAGAAQAGFQLTGPRLSDARLLALGEYLLNLRQGGR